ncbi:MAG: membrane protein insertase YidC [Candidatus Saccharibacteria bacterium]|nr:membrane protein insertase YidC [Candidatus Saccharibacteria bacterium]
MFFVDFLGWIMKICYDVVGNYGMAIILFTLVSKVILLPISIWVQKNSIKMVKMQPEINRLKINYFGDKDTIAEEESKIYKKYKYNPFASLIPLIAQIVILLGVVEIVKNPSFYIGVENLDFNFLGFDLRWITVEDGGLSILIPVIAGLSALVMCIGQNIMNVLQAEQSKWNQWGMLILSVGLSVYLGTFVTAGVALYWTASNLLAILQQWLLNIFINPKKYVDYEALDSSRKALQELQDLNKATKRTKEQIKKEKADYKRFFSIVNKKLVFYSESSGFYKYYKGIIEYILKNTNITIHYITSDFNDQVFEIAKTEKRLKPYYIEEKKLITLMMKMDADVVVMTMPDIDNFHIKRSYVRKDIEYIFISHGIGSNNLTMRKGSTDHYDSVLATDKYQYEEYKKTDEVYHLKPRKIIKCGYPLLDDMITDYKKSKQKSDKRKTIMVAPSWQKDNIIDLCLGEILQSLKGKDYDIIVRPHPQHVRHMKEFFEKMKEDYAGTNITIQTDFSNTDSIFNSDILITDWSGIAHEYCFTTEKPLIFIDTPMKIMNPEYKKIEIEPYEIWVRKIVGEVVKVEDAKNIDKTVDKMLKNYKKYQKAIVKLRNDAVYNLGDSATVGAEYIINCVQNKIKERKKK